MLSTVSGLSVQKAPSKSIFSGTFLSLHLNSTIWKLQERFEHNSWHITVLIAFLVTCYQSGTFLRKNKEIPLLAPRRDDFFNRKIPRLRHSKIKSLNSFQNRYKQAKMLWTARAKGQMKKIRNLFDNCFFSVDIWQG